MSTVRILQPAERSGVPATTLRLHESAGPLPADRSPAGYRLHGGDAVERLAFTGAAKHLGLPLEEVAELLAVRETGACAEVEADGGARRGPPGARRRCRRGSPRGGWQSACWAGRP
ncbi:hypothetical protein GCM10010145_22160 [Streptomyces ruber]|uniref:HTH merR-type domain-containing protein n=2 Tax=Streptomyces TaxID=1883 RepID=A0A918BAI5_9ACTN|nr:MerR family transcriptional regulator [Streptomyces ruber]GGQ52325.1 hypothetical protein GCM10010145_22160 [Streptomyces ruber]